ncbi:glycoside hydrolase family 108 protein [Terasakiella pusilla]|uniref:glycoside hydrolase family 108 protein n=1 Tax=Terasakiella pusilla TaxID=64973 RepID=UPI003AA83A7C
MPTLKTRVINHILKIEGGYVNDPDDRGGETKFGITKKVARAWGYTGQMKDLSRQTAFAIYETNFWDHLCLDAIATLSHKTAAEIADTAVNMGQVRAVLFLQRALNALNNRATLYADIATDGQMGPQTLAALTGYFNARKNDDGETVLVNALNCLQGAKYIDLTTSRETDEKYLFGWMKNRISIL